MSLEFVSTLAAVATFVVIATTAVAALVQLRHLQAGNQLAAMLSINALWDSVEMSRADSYLRTQLPERLRQSDYASSLLENRRNREQHPEVFLCDIWEQIGTLIKYRFVQQDPLLDIAGGAIYDHWERLALTIAILRARFGPAIYENFEYVAALGKQWRQRHPNGAYPASMERLPLPRPEKSTPAPSKPGQR
jgi:hypothetical protein